jgi:conjugal transfer pilus assembly protein TraV
MRPLRQLPLLIAFLLTGCANVLNTANHDEFACPGMPAGVMCKSPLQVYRATHDASHGATPDRDLETAALAKRSGAQTSQETFDDGSGLVSLQPEKAARDKPSALPLPLHLPIAQSASPNLPLPVLEPAKVMRIWIAPWEDSKKDLHWPSYLFTEIQPRKWSFGKAEFTGSRPVIPHLMVTPSAQPTLHDRPESGRVGSVQPVSSPQAVTGIPEAALPQAGDALLGGR